MRNPRILVVDRSEDLVAQVRAVAARLRPRPEVTVSERLGSFDDLDTGAFDVVVAGPSLANRSGLGRLAVLHTQLPSLSIVLAFTERPDANLREVVRTGAVDLLHLPVTDDFLLETLERAVAMSRSADSGADEAAARTVRATREPKVLTLASPAGGSGKTTLALNMAYHLKQRLAAAVCVVDLDLEFGRVASALRLRPRYTIADLVQRDEGDEDVLQQFIAEYLVEHDTGVSVLAAPKDVSEADAVGGADVIRVLQALRARFDFVVVDTPSSLNEVVLSAFDVSDTIYVVCPLDLPNLRTLTGYLNTLGELKISSDDIRLVLNKEERDTGIDPGEVAKLFKQGFSTILPYCRDVSASLNLGTPLLAYRPNTDFSRRLMAGLEDVVGEAAPDAEVAITPNGVVKAPGAERRGWLRALTR